MGFELKVSYKAPSEERVFLGDGWGVRDIRGPYICKNKAEIVIGNWALSHSIPSEVVLSLSMTNRAAVDALMIRVTGPFGFTHAVLSKREQKLIILPEVLSDSTRGSIVLVLEPGFGNDFALSPGTVDIVALDELQINR
jgi:hypothetical protein